MLNTIWRSVPLKDSSSLNTLNKNAVSVPLILRKRILQMKLILKWNNNTSTTRIWYAVNVILLWTYRAKILQSTNVLLKGKTSSARITRWTAWLLKSRSKCLRTTRHSSPSLTLLMFLSSVDSSSRWSKRWICVKSVLLRFNNWRQSWKRKKLLRLQRWRTHLPSPFAINYSRWTTVKCTLMTTLNC